MRSAYLWPAALMLAACAHGSNETDAPHTTGAVASQTQGLSSRSQDADGARGELSPDIIERPHPAREVRQLTRPPAGEAAKRSTERQSSGAAVSTAAPPAAATAPVEVALETTDDRHSPVPVEAPKPAGTKVVTAPLREETSQPPPKLGADIARADVELRERVQRALQQSSSLSYTAKHVQVDVAQRDVTLRGEVRTAHERGEMEQIVRSLPGVRSLKNEVALINPPTVPAR